MIRYLNKNKIFFIYMDNSDTLEYVINKNIHSNFHKISYNDIINTINNRFHDLLFKMSNELFRIEKYLQCCNIHGLFNVLKIINDLTENMDNNTTNITQIINRVSILEYIKLKQIISQNILPVYKNIYNLFINIINKYNIEIRARFLHFLENEGYDIEMSREKYNNDIDGLNRRLADINNRLINCINTIK